MGQPITVIEKASQRHGVVRFETNRVLTGTGHERYRPGDVIVGNRPPDVLARRLLERGGIDQVHVNGSVVSVDCSKGHSSEGIKEIIESLYTYYLPGVEVPAFPEEPAAAS
ncbi:MAG TPA: hypothetical protein DEG43_16840 [Acidimicrobiaceae bacterium]|jgi:ribose 1,5-bisphosphokinase PhnN|nr:hypothetical protein [Acidimicrobiaceae bacterium]